LIDDPSIRAMARPLSAVYDGFSSGVFVSWRRSIAWHDGQECGS